MNILGYGLATLFCIILIIAGLVWFFGEGFGAMMSDNPSEAAKAGHEAWWGLVPIIAGIVALVMLYWKH